MARKVKYESDEGDGKRKRTAVYYLETKITVIKQHANE
jgi:hypothetical protein